MGGLNFGSVIAAAAAAAAVVVFVCDICSSCCFAHLPCVKCQKGGMDQNASQVCGVIGMFFFFLSHFTAREWQIDSFFKLRFGTPVNTGLYSAEYSLLC